ncbi:MAG: DNA polymerase I [Candidatus Omnitrophica bacterium]|nr:DNA polymerase I [Candidatus Omnitrophota bacterium]
MNPKRLFLIDGNSFCYRAYYAIRELRNSKGFPTNAAYGFIAMLKKIIDSESPDYLAVSFDLKGPTFRHEKFEDYKAHRKPMPDDLVVQMPVIKDILRGYNIPIYEKEGFEADDIIGTVATKAEKKKIETFIVTGDKDALQLVSDLVKVYSTHKEGLIYDERAVKERYGVGPDAVIDIMALMGDTSDNLPGVPGIGEKTAIELIAEFKSLDNLLKNIDSLKSEAKKKLIKENVEKAHLTKELATIDTDVDVDIDFDDMKLKEPDNEKLVALFKELEFKKLMEEFMSQEEIEGEYKVIAKREEFNKLLESLKKHKEWAFDFETTGIDPMDADVVGVSFCFKKGEACYISFIKTSATFSDKDYILKALKPIFENKDIKKIGQNIKYEKLLLKNIGIELKGISFDTMVASYLLNPSKLNHNLSDISLEYLGIKMTHISELIGKGRSQITMDKVPIPDISRYCCQDSDATFSLKSILEKKLKEKNLYELFCSIEIPLVDVLSDMEFIGVAIDKNFLQKMSVAMSDRLAKLTKEIYEMAEGNEFNINSPKQLAEVLFEKLKLPVVKRTKTGPSTDVEVLNKLATKHALPKTILEYRELTKLKSTYVDALPELINSKTKKVHTSFNQTVTATGRLSSSEPNLQNIPIKTDIGKRIRKAFISSFKDGVILSADYSQIELRILAHLSGDKNLLDAFKRDIDIHTYTASLIFDCKESDVDEKMRSQAKTVNFGIVYGMSPYGLAKELGIAPDTAKVFIDAYFSRYPKVNEYMQETIAFAKENGYVLTMLNRRRYIPEINSNNQNIRMFAERTAINTPIQGSAADIIKMAMIHIDEELRKKKLIGNMVLQVHDELVFDLPKKELKEMTAIVKKGMEEVVKLKVPISVNISSAKNWMET